MPKLLQYNGKEWIEIAKNGLDGKNLKFSDLTIDERASLEGPRGVPGMTVRLSDIYEGAWNVNSSYLVDEIVVYEDNTYFAKRPNKGVTPGTNDFIWQFLAPYTGGGGDRYKTTSTTSNSIVSNGSLTFTVDTGLSYITQQDVIIAHDSSNHMHGTITSYNETTGEMIVDIQHKIGSGTYSSWEINLDGIDAGVPTLQQVAGEGNVTTTTIESAGFIKTGGTSSQFLKADGSVDNTTYGTGTIDGTMTAGRVVLAQDANTVETDDDLSFNGSALGIGTTTPLARRLHTVNPTSTFTTITGTVSFANVVFVGNVTGTGTLFTTEFKVGDFLVHPTQDAQKATVLRIVSNTSMQILTMNALFISGSGTGYRRLDRTNAVIDTSGTTISTESYGQFNTFTGAGNVPTRILNGTTFFQNIQAPQHGLIIDTFANDGRMRIGHSESTNANIIFQQGNANIGINYATLSNALWSMPLYLGLASFGSNQTGIYMERSGTGANQQIRQWTTRFAVHGDAPSFQMSANGLDFGRRDGSVWNEGIDAITLSMNKTTGKWSIGSLGTTTPAGATTRLDFATVGETFGIKTGTNAAVGTATLVAGTVTINTTAITANTMIVLSPGRTSTGNMGVHYESARTAGTSFTITSTNASDTSTFDWHFVEKL